MTRARVKALHDKVNSLLTTLDLDTPLDGLLPQADMLCVIRYEPREKNITADPKMDKEEGEEESQLKDAPQGRHCRPPGTGTAGLQTPALPAPPAEGATKARTGTAGPSSPALPAQPLLT